MSNFDSLPLTTPAIKKTYTVLTIKLIHTAIIKGTPVNSGVDVQNAGSYFPS